MSELRAHARRELERAGLFDKDSDYEGMIGDAVMDLVRCFSRQGHSGFSARLTVDVFTRVASYQALGPLTSDPSEWMHIREDMAGRPNLWQSRRRPSAFSSDGGKTYHDIDEAVARWRRAARWLRLPVHPRRMHKALAQ